MNPGKQLLLLAAFLVVARCQQKPEVSMSPRLTQIFTGDSFYLTCDKSANTVKWYVEDAASSWTNKTVKIAVASPMHSGSYQCESDGQKSERFRIDVLEYLPSASLIITTGQPVMRTSDAIVLKIENEDGLQGWNCWVYREKTGKENRIKLKLNNDTVSLTFQTSRLTVPETIFWCTNSDKTCRSNQITIRTSDKPVSLEMYPLPALVGETLTLRCLAWGTDRISRTTFYRNDQVIAESNRFTHTITVLSNLDEGKYKCKAIYTHVAQTGGGSHDEVSDNQDVFTQERPVTAVLSENMACSCPGCPAGMSYHYYKKHDESWALLNSKPWGAGTFSCRAVWANKRTSLSASVVSDGADSNLILIIFMLIAGLVIVIVAAAVACYIRQKSTNATGPIYEDVALRLREEGDAKYETLQKGSGREAEYDTLHPGVEGRETRSGDNEQTRKEEMKEGVYHTLGMEGAAGGRGEGGYEALKKGGMKEGVYHTLGLEGAAAGGGEGGGEGGYEALKKDGMKEGVYHTLGVEGAAAGGGEGGGEGGYEALKKEGIKEGVYHTLGMEGATAEGGKIGGE